MIEVVEARGRRVIASATRGRVEELHVERRRVSEMTRMPDACAEAMSMSVSGGPPSASSRQLSDDACARPRWPSEVLTWPVTVSASMSRTSGRVAICSAAARFVAIVVLPTPPFGLKTAITVARRAQPSAVHVAPPWRTGPLPSSTVWLRMHMASTRQRSDSAERAGEVSSSTLLAVGLLVQRSKRPRRDDHQRRDGAAAVVQEPVVLERLVEVGLAVEDRDGDVAAVLEEGLELVGVLDRDRR